MSNTFIMSNGIETNKPPARKSILTVSLSRCLTGEPIASVIESEWRKADNITDNFENQGFDLDVENSVRSLEELRNELRSRAWDGRLFGWCSRGHVECTKYFEQVVNVCVEEAKSISGVKMMFCTGFGQSSGENIAEFPRVSAESSGSSFGYHLPSV